MKIFILVIAGEPASQRGLSQYLEKQGCEALVSADAGTALKALGERNINAAVIGSTNLLRDFLAGDPRARKLPVILLEEAEGAAEKSGLAVDEVLAGSAEPKQVFSSIVRVLSRRSKLDAGSERLDEMIDNTYELLRSLRESLGISDADFEDLMETEGLESDEDAPGSLSSRLRHVELVPPDIRENLRVMVVDGDREHCDAMLKAFGGKDYVVEYAPNGQIALESMRKNHAQILITELRLPVLSGKAVIAITKKEFRETAVVVLTGNPDDMPLKEALELGVDEYLIKPVRDEELLFIAERAYYRHIAIIKSSLRSDRLSKLELELSRLRQRETALKEELFASRDRESNLRKELISARKAIAEIKKTLDGSGLRKLLGLE